MKTSVLVDTGIGALSFQPKRNYDQRLDMELKKSLKWVGKNEEKQIDSHLTHKLDT